MVASRLVDRGRNKMNRLAVHLSLLLNLLVHAVMSSPVVQRESGIGDLRPHFPGQVTLTEDVFGPLLPYRGDRDKRTIRTILDLVFWKINSLLDAGTKYFGDVTEYQRTGRWPGANARTTTTPKPDETASSTEDIPEFDEGPVKLQPPGNVFNAAFDLVTNVSTVVGNTIMNTARRTQRFFEDLKPILRGVFGIEITTNEMNNNEVEQT